MARNLVKRVAKAKDIKHVVVFSDTHIGCQLSILPKTGGMKTEGGLYKPSAFQKKIYKCWEDFWNVQVPKMTQGEPYDIVFNGDAIEGVHHRSTGQWTHNLADQARAVIQLFQPVIDNCPGRFYFIRGTEAHVGASGQEEENIARELGAVPDNLGNHSRYEMFKKLKGGVIHFTHHISAVATAANEGSAVYRELVEMWIECARWGDRAVDVIVRSHRHKHFCNEVATDRGKSSSCVTPCWQGKTGFIHRIAGGRNVQPQFGGICLNWSDREKFIYELHRVYRMKRPNPV